MPILEMPRFTDNFEMHDNNNDNSFSLIVDISNDEYYYNNTLPSMENTELTKYEESEDHHVPIFNVVSQAQDLLLNELTILDFTNDVSDQQYYPSMKNYLSIFHIFGNKETHKTISQNKEKDETNFKQVSKLGNKSSSWTISKLLNNFNPINLILNFNNRSFNGGLTPFSEFLLKINDFNFL